MSGFIPAGAQKVTSEWQIFQEEYEKSCRSHSSPSSASKLKKQLKLVMTDRTEVLIDSKNKKVQRIQCYVNNKCLKCAFRALIVNKYIVLDFRPSATY
jgi:hypothetical protein